MSTLACAAVIFALGFDEPSLLEQKGLKRVGDTYVLLSEQDFQKKFRELQLAQKKFRDAARGVDAVEKKSETQRKLISQAIVERRRLGDQLPRAAELDPSAHNRMVARINQLNIVIREHYERERDDKAGAEARSSLGAARAALVQLVLDLRRQADEIAKEYASLSKDAAVAEAIAESEEGDPPALGPSRGFARNLALLEKAEAQVHSETIPLRSEGNVFWTEVVLNGKRAAPMMVDTGASIICLPGRLAQEVGLKPAEGDTRIELSLADGRAIEATLMKLDSVKVGKFEVSDVECAVLPASLKDAAPLLGGNFLRHFSYKIDPDRKQLTLSKVDGPPAGSAASKDAKATAKRKK